MDQYTLIRPEEFVQVHSSVTMNSVQPSGNQIPNRTLIHIVSNENSTPYGETEILHSQKTISCTETNDEVPIDLKVDYKEIHDN